MNDDYNNTTVETKYVKGSGPVSIVPNNPPKESEEKLKKEQGKFHPLIFIILIIVFGIIIYFGSNIILNMILK